MTMTLNEVKVLLDDIPYKERWSVLGELIDAGCLENRIYTLEEIGFIMGISKQAVKAIETSAMNKLKEFAQDLI